MIRVAIHGDLAHNTGIARYTRSLLTELGQMTTTVAVRVLTYPLRPERPGWLPQAIAYRRSAIPGRIQKAFVEGVGVGVDRFVGRRTDELVHLTTTTTWMPRSPFVLTVYDLAWRLFGSEYGSVMPSSAIQRLETAISRADHIVSISQTTTDALIEGGIPANHITTTRLGVSADFFEGTPSSSRGTATRFGITKPYILYVGAMNLRKGLPTLAAAVRQLASEREVELVAVGPPPPDGLSAWQLDHKWMRHLGYVAERDLLDLYATAAAVAIPTRLEGFGLPLIEAMASGVPVVASDIPVFREIGGGCALLTRVDDVAEFYAALKRVLDDDHFAQDLGLRGREHAKNFTWRKCADATLDAYRIAASGK